MPNRLEFRLCRCIICTKDRNPEGCHIEHKNWKSHQRLARTEEQKLSHSNRIEKEENTSDDGKASHILFGMAYNNELGAGR